MIVIHKPLITEKTMKLAQTGQYTFLVNKYSRKPEIKRAVAAQFGVDVVGIKTLTVKPKVKPQKTRRGYFSTPELKKAVIVVKKGQKIVIFEEASKPKEETEGVTITSAEGEPITEVKEKKSLLRKTKVKIERGGK